MGYTLLAMQDSSWELLSILNSSPTPLTLRQLLVAMPEGISPSQVQSAARLLAREKPGYLATADGRSYSITPAGRARFLKGRGEIPPGGISLAELVARLDEMNAELAQLSKLQLASVRRIAALETAIEALTGRKPAP